MTARVLLLGSTELTLGAAGAIERTGAKVGAIVHVNDTFQISYARDGVKNYRAANVQAWCAEHDAEAIAFEDFPALMPKVAAGDYSIALLAGWYHMVPRALRAAFRHGCVGLHASLLPKLRGGAPLSWAILAGLDETGVSMFAVGDGIDDGPLYDQERLPIGPHVKIADLVSDAGDAAARIIGRSLPAILSGDLVPRPQTGEASYCLQRTPEDGRVDWRLPSETIARLVRAVGRPYPGALTTFDDRTIAIHAATPVSLPLYGVPGQIAILPGFTGPVVVCGHDCLLISEAEFEDGEDAQKILRASAHERLGS